MYPHGACMWHVSVITLSPTLQRLIFCSVPSQLEKRTKDLMATMAYIDMTINLNRRVQHVTRPGSSSRQKPQYLSMEDQYCLTEIRVLPFKARKGLVAATAKLGIRLTTIVESLKGNHDLSKVSVWSPHHQIVSVLL